MSIPGQGIYEGKTIYPIPSEILSLEKLKSIRGTSVLNNLQREINKANNKGLTRLYINYKLSPTVKYNLRSRGYTINKDSSNCLCNRRIKRYIDWK